jgi:hypothetical protein
MFFLKEKERLGAICLLTGAMAKECGYLLNILLILEAYKLF